MLKAFRIQTTLRCLLFEFELPQRSNHIKDQGVSLLLAALSLPRKHTAVILQYSFTQYDGRHKGKRERAMSVTNHARVVVDINLVEYNRNNS